MRYRSEHNLTVVPGGSCGQSSLLDGYIRVCFAYVDESQLEEGAKRLVTAIEAFVELLKKFDYSFC
jgi:DNA-binding transcriptional MocR family regulator